MYPVKVSVHSGVDPREAWLSAPYPPRHNTDHSPASLNTLLQEEWSSTVTLARILAASLGPSAQDCVHDGLLVGVVTVLVVPNGDGHFLQGLGHRASVVDGAPSCNGRFFGFVDGSRSGQADRPHVGIEGYRLRQRQDGDVVDEGRGVVAKVLLYGRGFVVQRRGLVVLVEVVLAKTNGDAVGCEPLHTVRRCEHMSVRDEHPAAVLRAPCPQQRRHPGPLVSVRVAATHDPHLLLGVQATAKGSGGQGGAASGGGSGAGGGAGSGLRVPAVGTAHTHVRALDEADVLQEDVETVDEVLQDAVLQVTAVSSLTARRCALLEGRVGLVHPQQEVTGLCLSGGRVRQVGDAQGTVVGGEASQPRDVLQSDDHFLVVEGFRVYITLGPVLLLAPAVGGPMPLPGMIALVPTRGPSSLALWPVSAVAPAVGVVVAMTLVALVTLVTLVSRYVSKRSSYKGLRCGDLESLRWLVRDVWVARIAWITRIGRLREILGLP